MTARWREWWGLRSAREQRLLMVMAGLFALVLAWLVIVRPIGDLLAEARARQIATSIAAARAETQAATIAALERSRPRRSSAPVAARVTATAGDAGLTLARTTPRGDAVEVGIEAVRPRAFFAWVARLERDEGLVIDSLAARANPDRTLSAQLSVRGRRG